MCMTKLLQLMTKIKIYALQKKKKSHLLLDLLQLKLNEPSIVETDGKLKICLGCNSLGSWLLLFSVVINAWHIKVRVLFVYYFEEKILESEPKKQKKRTKRIDNIFLAQL